MQYLREKQHYIDRYDLITIEICLDYYWSIKDGLEKERHKANFKKFNKEEFDREVHKVASYTVNAIKDERYRHKAEKIREWIERDQRMQDKLDNAVPPVGIYCKECHASTKLASTDLMNSYQDDSYVLFMFECTKCNKRQPVYEDGKEWHYEPPRCPKCEASLKSKIDRQKNGVLVFTYSCLNCSYIRKDVDDLKKSRKESQEKEVRDKKLLGEYRNEFCLNDTNGPAYIASMDRLINFTKEWEEREKKKKDPIYQKANSLKKLKLIELKELIEKMIEKQGYKDLQFGKPEIGRNVIVDFSATDTKESRKEYDSRTQLQKLMRVGLEDTNWRLMSDGISYRLGILTGKLKAYELEEDLVKLIA